MPPAIRLLDAAAARSDNFLPLRHLAALMVIYGHSYAIGFNPDGTKDLFAALLPGFYAGNLAVHLFFAISGYLVTSSLIDHPGSLRYVRNRVVRVYPAYLMCVLACVLVLGPAFTQLPVSEYLRAAGTRAYLLDNLLPISFAWTLPGVFEHNPLPQVVNGTLWSLGLEVRWYFYLGVLASLRIVRRRWLFTLVAGAVLALGAWEWWSGKPDALEYRALSQTFLLAALVAQWRHRLSISHIVFVAALIGTVLAFDTRVFGAMVVLTALIFVFWFSYRLPRVPWSPRIDVSYGLFLYGYPVQQMLMAIFSTLPPLMLFIAATLCTLPLAAASWMWVEQPALRFKRSRQHTDTRAEPAP